MSQTFKHYFISDPAYITNNIHKLEKNLKNILKNKKIDFACFRDKTSNNYEELAKSFVKICKEFEIEKTFLNSNIELAIKLNCGIHLNSTQFDKIEYCKKNALFTIISCHNEDDIKGAISKKVDAITYSPIFETPNKGKPKGIVNLNEIVNKYDIKVFALGGIINFNQVKEIQKTKAYGFASIRYFI